MEANDKQVISNAAFITNLRLRATGTHNQQQLGGDIEWKPNSSIAGKHCYARVVSMDYQRSAAFPALTASEIILVTSSLPQINSSFACNVLQGGTPSTLNTQNNLFATQAHTQNEIIGLLKPGGGTYLPYPTFLTFIPTGPQTITFNVVLAKVSALATEATSLLTVLMEFIPID